MESLGRQRTKKQIQDIEDLYKKYGVAIPPDGELDRCLSLLKEYCSDFNVLTESEIFAKWSTTKFKEWYKNIIAIGPLASCANTLISQKEYDIKKHLLEIAIFGLYRGGNQSQAKNLFYELEMGTFFMDIGFVVNFEEPDLVVTIDDKDYAVACKMPATSKKIRPRINESIEQIQRRGMNGFTCISLDLVLFEKNKKMTSFITFPERNDDLLSALYNETINILAPIEQGIKAGRGEKNPLPPDNLMFTIKMPGVKNGGILVASHLTIRCQNSNPNLEMFEKIQLGANKRFIPAPI